jgi:hypothetical protein
MDGWAVTTREVVVVPGSVVRTLRGLLADDVSGDLYARLIASPAACAFTAERGSSLSREEFDGLLVAVRR